MTTTDTLPVSRPTVAPTPHEHAWLTESRHPTSDGTVVYVRCGSCAARRIDLESHTSAPAMALSRSIGIPRP